jgi:hypothetical protein
VIGYGFQLTFTSRLLEEAGKEFSMSGTGLPDGLFSNQKSLFGKILEGLRLENVDVFYAHFIEIWDIIRPSGIFCVYLVHFSRFGIKYQEKSGNPGHGKLSKR